MIVLEDPPSLIKLFLAEQRKSFVWLDSRNWADQGYPEQERLCVRLEWLVQLVRSVLHATYTCGVASLQPTIGAQALSVFRHSFLTHTMHAHTDARAMRLEQDGYYGGRCECFRVGKIPGRVFHLDYSSMYCSIGHGEELPNLFNRSGEGKPSGLRSMHGRYNEFIAEVSVSTNAGYYPCKRGGNTIFPRGTFRTTLCGPELEHAHKGGRIIAWHSWAEYTLSPCLKAFMGWALEQKRKSKENDHDGCVQWAKGIGVALVGKLASREKAWVDCPDDTSGRLWGEAYHLDGNGLPTRHRWIAGHCQKEVIGGWAHDSIPAVSAYVTSYGRVCLLNAINIAKRRNCYYCDTDSILCNRDGYLRLEDAGYIQPGVDGKMRLLNVSDDTEILGIKHYRHGGTIKCAGIPSGLHHLNGTPSTSYVYMAPGSAIRNGESPRAERHLHRYGRTMPYRFGVITIDGVVEPLTLGDECQEKTVTTGTQDAIAACAKPTIETLSQSRLSFPSAGM